MLLLCRRNVFPQLTPEAAQVLKAFYMSLRREHGDDEAAPITTRQLESLIRLSQARAKLELRQVCACAAKLCAFTTCRHNVGDACRK